MENIFSNLFKLKLKNSNNPTEDYLTEIFKYCLTNDKNIFSAFLKLISKNENLNDDYTIKSQESFEKLLKHECDSRPDLSIYFENNVIFIESKVDSTEGNWQLQRYAEHLIQFPDTTSKTLVYLTRDYENKEDISLFCKNNDVKFIRLRWYNIYEFLKEFKQKELIIDTLKFMENLGLSSNNQFNSVDFLTLNNFYRVRKMLDECMYGKAQEEFKKISNDKISQNSTALTQLRDHNRYILWADMKNSIWIGYGFWFNQDYPEIQFVIEIPPKSPVRNEIIKVFRQILNETSSKWKSYNIDNLDWSGIYLKCSLKDIISKENHIQTIQNTFFDFFQEFKLQYPKFNGML
ncbi:MAG: PD-(D/E)XK nuclease family protein [Emticicia sp.]|nr:PD-(D/E)XK nuclease family protein [Emticicia sp.]